VNGGATTTGPRSVAGLAVPAILGAAIAGVLGGVALHFATARSPSAPAPALPAFHGTQSWGSGQRRAPAFALRDQNGRLVSLASFRGRNVIVTFLDSHCREQCPIAGRQLGGIVRGLPPAKRPAVLIVSVNPADTARSVRAAARRWRLAPGWHWLLAPRSRVAATERAFGIEVRPAQGGDLVHSLAVYLVDRHGFERTGYVFPFLPGFVAHDLRTLARETA
jgi:protein SCO1/2